MIARGCSLRSCSLFRQYMPTAAGTFPRLKPRMPQNGYLQADNHSSPSDSPKSDLPAVTVPRIVRESKSQPGTPTERDRVLHEHRQLQPQTSFQYSISRRLSILEIDDDLEAAREQRILEHDLSGKLTDEELFGLGSSQAWKGAGWKSAQRVRDLSPVSRISTHFNKQNFNPQHAFFSLIWSQLTYAWQL